MEEWKDIKQFFGFERLYQISNKGRVLSVRRQKLLKPYKNNKGYLVVKLCKEYQEEAMRVHRLVAIAFIPNPENKPQVNHKDGNKQNNCAENLEWCDNSHNQKHANEIGLKLSLGEKHHFSKLTEKQVIDIRSRKYYWGFYADLAKEFNIDENTVWSARNKETWKHLK